MSRTALRLGTACAVVFVAAVCLRGDDRTNRIESQLTVAASLRSGLDLIQCGDFAGAVKALEKHVGLINGNREYLVALRDAYVGYVRQLQTANRPDEVKVYQKRLAILEPSSANSLANSGNSPAKAQPTRPVFRGVKEDNDSDPFHESNRATGTRAQSLIAQAEKAFEEKQYDSAAELYASARRISGESVSACSERWAYCRLYAVARAINRGETGRTAELKREVQQAAAMSPKFEEFANSLLKRLDEPDSSSSVEVKHTPRANGGWARAETTNFRIFHATTEAEAEKIARIAESTRVNMTKKWFGEEAVNWTPRCDLYVHPTGQGYAKATGAPATAPGHSSIKQEGVRILERRIDLRGDNANMMTGVLPHETTHVVLAGKFGSHDVPRWADEGMAVLSEPRDLVEMHLRNLPKHQTERTLFPVAELMGLANYPEPRRVGPFYAQSVSLVDFMCKKKDPQTFAKFLRESLDGKNTETALRRHFGYASSADLEREWREHAFGSGAVASRSDKKK